ncbi:MAG: beta-glucanase (GH16 family) [Flavobacteriales bacterium]|jgi:beta-glucanase (GH16 family)
MKIIKEKVAALGRRMAPSVKIVGLSACCALSISANAQVGEIIWEDNFDSFNAQNWTKDVGNGCGIGLCGWGNQELQWYAEDNVTVEAIPNEPGNSALVFDARDETIEGSVFTSGKVNSAQKIAIRYGMIETRIRVPDLAEGFWPAAWLLGTSTQSWPAKGEIDMMEMGAPDDAPTNNHVGSNIIFYSEDACVDANPTCAASTAWNTPHSYFSQTPMNDRFITYRTYWTEDQIRFTAIDDGVEYDMYETPFTITETSAAFREPFYLLFNLAIGGTFTGQMTPADISAPRPGKMYIDYVRVYKLDGQGEIFAGNVTPAETGTFGVYTETTLTTNALEIGTDSSLFIWDANSTPGNEAAYEGGEVISLDFNTPGGWFGGGVLSHQARDMSNFSEGSLKFKVKIPADVSFQIGISDTFSNENWITFPANETTYGLVRNGEWGEVTIPVSDLRGSLVAIQSLGYVFTYLSASDVPSNTFSYAFDDIVWVGGGDAPLDSDLDGVVDEQDSCPNTSAGVEVGTDGCALDSDLDGVNNEQDSCPNTPPGAEVGTDGCAIVTIVQLSPVASASSEMTPASFAVDGNTATRWESTHGVDPSWISFDLGDQYALDSIVINWEAANAESYVIQASNDESTWVALSNQTGGLFGERVDTVGLNGSYRYLRVYGTSRSIGNAWGYSIWEVQIFGGQSVSTDSDGDGVLDDSDECANTPSGTEVNAIGCPIINEQLVAVASASSELLSAGNATDGNLNSRWESLHGVDPSWLLLDLGSAHVLSEVIIDWEAANAANYNVQGSNDNTNWTSLHVATGGEFGARTDTVALSGQYRYVRIYGTERSVGNNWGYSIWEVSIFGSSSL